MSNGKGYLQAVVGFILSKHNRRSIILVGLVAHSVENLVGFWCRNFSRKVERVANGCTSDLDEVVAVIAVEVVLTTEYHIIADYTESVECFVVIIETEPRWPLSACGPHIAGAALVGCVASEPYSSCRNIVLVIKAVKGKNGYCSCPCYIVRQVRFDVRDIVFQERACIAGESSVGCASQCEVIADDDELRTAPTIGLVIRCGDIDLAPFGYAAVSGRFAE